jgi:predicted dehydrogenase
MLDQTQNLDAVIVATPSHLHRQPATDALAASQHVYCEGPLATSIEDCRAIALAARESDKVFQTGMQGRSDPVYTLARNFYRSGSIRDLVEMHAQYRRKTSWRAASNRHDWKLDPAVSMGLIGEFGTHQFDVMHWYTGKYPTHVRARGAVLAYPDGREVADTVSAELTFPGGITMTYQATLANSYEGQYELLVGTMGAIKLGWTHGWLFKEADAPTQGWEVYANRQNFHNDEGITLIANATQLADQGKLQDGVGLEHPPLYYALESFLKSITEQTPIACTAEEGLRAAAVSIQTVRALRTGEEVGIDESLFQTNR